MHSLPVLALLFAVVAFIVEGRNSRLNLEALAEGLFGENLQGPMSSSRSEYYHPDNRIAEGTMTKAFQSKDELKFVTSVWNSLLHYAQERITEDEASNQIVDEWSRLADWLKKDLLRNYAPMKIISDYVAPRTGSRGGRGNSSDPEQVKKALEGLKNLTSDWKPPTSVTDEFTKVTAAIQDLLDVETKWWTSDDFKQIAEAFQEAINALIGKLANQASITNDSAENLIHIVEHFCRILDLKGFPNMSAVNGRLQSLVGSGKDGEDLVKELSKIIKNVVRSI